MYAYIVHVYILGINKLCKSQSQSVKKKGNTFSMPQNCRDLRPEYIAISIGIDVWINFFSPLNFFHFPSVEKNNKLFFSVEYYYVTVIGQIISGGRIYSSFFFCRVFLIVYHIMISI